MPVSFQNKPAPSGASEVVDASLMQAMREDPSLLVGIVGHTAVHGDALRDARASVDKADIAVHPHSYDEQRGRFHAVYDVTGAADLAISRVDAKGFLTPDGAVIETIRSASSVMMDGSLRSVLFDAQMDEGRIQDSTVAVDPTFRTRTDIGMANGVLVDLGAPVPTPIDVSGVPDVAVAELVEDVKESDLGVVQADLVHGWVGGLPMVAGFDGIDITESRDHEAQILLEHKSVESPERIAFEQGMIARFKEQHAPLLDKAVADMGAFESPLAVPIDPDKAVYSVTDFGHAATVVMEPRDNSTPMVLGLNPIQVEGIYDIVPGRDPVMRSVQLQAQKIIDFEGVSMKTEKITSFADRDGSVGSTRGFNGTEVVLVPEGGRLYAVSDFYVDNFSRSLDGLGSLPYPVSEVKGRFDGTGLKDLLKEVTSKDGVHEWTVPVLGTVGEGPVRVDRITSFASDFASSVDEHRMKPIDAAVAKFRTDNGHDRGIMAQAGMIAGKDVEPTVAKGGADRSDTLFERMKAIASGMKGR